MLTSKISKLAVIIPALNEADSIKIVIDGCKKFADVIVVNDGSTDNTSEVAKMSGAIVVDLKENIGVDGATFAGLEKAHTLGHEFAITLDADGQHDPSFIKDFTSPLFEGEVVMVHGIRPNSARLAERIMRLYALKMYGISDILCGFKGYALQQVYAPNKKMRKFKTYSTSLPWCVINDGLSFAQVKIPVYPRAQNDKPRIGGTIKANFRILSALMILVFFDLQSFIFNPKKFIKTRF